MKTTNAKRSFLRAGVFGTAAALALLAACEAKVPTGPEIEAMDVASASKAATGTRLVMKSQMDSAVYYVDGRAVDAKTANALTPNQIATIDINKGGARPEIRIVTNGQAAIPRGQPYKGSTQVTVRGLGVSDTSGGPNSAYLRGARTAMNSPLILIDGVKADDAKLHALDPKSIESVQVLKGSAAGKFSTDPAAANGVIVVTTKK